MDFVRFEDYYLGRPPFDRVFLKVIGDSNALISNILSGSLDIVLPPGIDLDAALEVKRRWEGTGNVVRVVFKLQKRIFQASARGDRKTVHRLQRLLLRSRAARLLAVRRVAQDNRGQRTAGVDGVKSLRPAARLRLAQSLRLSHQASPTRRVWIPKPGSDEQRPLGCSDHG